MSHAILHPSTSSSISISTPTSSSSHTIITLQSILSQHANQPNSALSALIQEFNRITAQLSSTQARLSEFESGHSNSTSISLIERQELIKSRNKLQDENRQLWTLISKSKAELKDVKAENRDLRHRITELEHRLGLSSLHSSGRVTPQGNHTTTTDLEHHIPSDRHRPHHHPRSSSDTRRASETNNLNQKSLPQPSSHQSRRLTKHSNPDFPLESSLNEFSTQSTPLPSLKKPSLASPINRLPIHTPSIPSTPTQDLSYNSLNHPQSLPIKSSDTTLPPSPSNPPVSLLSSTPSSVETPKAQKTPSPTIRRRASSVDMGRRAAPVEPYPHPLASHPSVSDTSTRSLISSLSQVTNSPDRPENSHRPFALSSPADTVVNSIHTFESLPSGSSMRHSVIPAEVRQYMLGNPLVTSPIISTHPHPVERPFSSDHTTSIGGEPTSSSHIPSAALLDPQHPSSPTFNDQPNRHPSKSIEQSLYQRQVVQPDSQSSLSGTGSSSGAVLTSAPSFASQRLPKPPTSPTPSQHGQASNSGASVHSSSSAAHPPADTVYTTQPMTKRRMLTPTFLPFTHINVTNSHIRANDKSKEVISFSITINVVIPPESDPERKGAKASWVVEKLYSDVLSLDQVVKSKHSRVQNRALAQLPDRALFKDHAPSKVDARKAVLTKYLQSLCAAQLTEKGDVCDFFNSNIVINERNATSSRPGFMQGYLTKKGRNFGGWQTRFYVLEGPILEYFDTRGGNRLGHIVITGAQIGRQQQRSQEVNDDSYRHAFLIRMHKREKEGEIDHILCAETDEERDAWVEALTCYVTGRYVSAEPASGAPSNTVQEPPRRASPSPSHSTEAKAILRQTSLDTSLHPESSQMHASHTAHHHHHHPSSSYDQHVDPRSHKNHSHMKVESVGQASSVSDSGVRHSASTIMEEKEPTISRGGAADPSVRPDAQDHARPHNPHGTEPKEREHHTRPPHLEPRVPSHPHATNYAGPTTPRQALNQARLAQPTSHSSPQQEQVVSDADSIATNSADRPTTPDSQQRPKISGPMNGVPITGGYRIKPPEEKKAKFRSAFWGFTGRTGLTDRKDSNTSISSNNLTTPFAPAPRPVFGVSLQEAVSVARVHEGLDLPAVVFRCVEFLEAKGAIDEEGIYRLSGSSVNIKSYKERFNTEGDFNLLESSKQEYHDVHAVAGLLKQFLRELSSPILTRELHAEFLKVIDLSQRSDKVNELGRLCAELPLPNYTLLRFLSAHLIHIVQNEKINKMSMRNVGIVFSPTLGMPAPLFALLLKEFDLIFNIEGDNRAPIRLPGESDQPAGHLSVATTATNKRMSRNSMLYSATGVDMLMEDSKLPRSNPAVEEDSESEVDYDSNSEPDDEVLVSSRSMTTNAQTPSKLVSPNQATAETQASQERPAYLRRASAQGLSLSVSDSNRTMRPTPSPTPQQHYHKQTAHLRSQTANHRTPATLSPSINRSELPSPRSPNPRVTTPRPRTAGA